MSGLIEVVHGLEAVFDRLSLGRSYGGAIAYNYWGPPRLTEDVDVLVPLPDSKIPPLVEALGEAGCLQGGPAPKPIALPAVLADLRAKAHLTVFQWEAVRVEVFVPWHPFHQRVLARSPARDFAGRTIRIHSAADLIVFKKIFDRPKDVADIKAMLLTQKGRLDVPALLAEAKDLLPDESWRELRDLAARYG